MLGGAATGSPVDVHVVDEGNSRLEIKTPPAIGMIDLRAEFPYLARLCRCFLLADILFLRNPVWCEEQPEIETRFILVRVPVKRVKAIHPVATLVLLVFGEIVVTM